ncbi:MAG: type II toxin-antitoxin system ParD family antitoxin [Acidobacteriia bacterium]|nr:type II toxin-antitoxin system ParD family antitoxin [Terriglobia bacterium]MYG02373.1 type II toxin-antitoxin system ParD family antitoxin [Terriglobia bacterium]MYK08490.1 type II toxin-antitoxin system ParD family antitoxin [Terriglobia bacterium]
MGAVRKTIAVTNSQDRWIKAQISAGHYANDSDYIRDLIRRDRQRLIDADTLRVAIQEGLDSGTSDKTVASVMEEVETRQRRDGQL